MARVKNVALVAQATTKIETTVGDHSIVSVLSGLATDTIYATARNIDIAAELAAEMTDDIFIITGMGTAIVPDTHGEVYLYTTSSDVLIEVIGTNSLNHSFSRVQKGGEEGEYVDLSTNQTIGGEKTFTNGIYAVDGVFASGYTQSSLPTDIEGVAMYKSGAISRISALIKSAANVITYKALAFGAYVSGKYSAMFNANGTVDFNFDVTAPTQTAGDSTTKVATTEFTQTAVNNKAPYVGTTAPTNTDLLWRDTSVSPAVLKQYNGSAWVEVGGSPMQDTLVNQSIVWTTSVYNTVVDMSAHKGKYRQYIVELPVNSTLNPYVGLNYGETGTTTQVYKLSTTAGQTGVDTNTSGATASAKIGTGYILCGTYKAYIKIDCVGTIGFSEINGDIVSSPDPVNIVYTSTNGVNNIHLYNSTASASTFTLKIYGVK